MRLRPQQFEERLMSWLTLDVLLLARLLLKLAVGPVLERKGDITMFYVGLDIAAEKHDCCIMTEERQVLKQFVFRNDAEGFEFLKKNIDQACSYRGNKDRAGEYRRVRQQSGPVS